jgi:hypothetical protein
MTTSSRGKKAIVVEGIKYTIMSENNSKILWRCSFMANKKTKCPARIVQMKDPLRFLQTKKEHQHADLVRGRYNISKPMSVID